MVVNPMFTKRSILIDWLTDWLTDDWLIDLLIDWLTDWLIFDSVSRRVALFENKEKIGSKKKDEDKK